MIKLTKFSDSAHGWLRVSKTFYNKLGLREPSQFSYRSSRYFYLEEDCDAGIFLDALTNKGILFSMKVKHTERSRIRDL